MSDTNREHRHLELCVDGPISASEGFAADGAAFASTALDGRARLRLWRRAEPALCLGRFHRRAAAAPAQLERRQSGGRAVLLGPGVLGATLALPSTEWLDDQGAGLRPDQVMNRALRPLLAVLRGFGADVLYPGRDLVTWKGAALAHASFSVLPDGVTVVEAHVNLSDGWSRFADQLAALDPDGVAGIDPASWQGAADCAQAFGTQKAGLNERLGDQLWAERLEAACASEFRAEVSRGDCRQQVAVAADAQAYQDFLDERGPAAEGPEVQMAVTFAMLGVVEAVATVRGGRFRDLEVCGDLIAPFHCLDDLAAALEGRPVLGPEVRRALVGVMSRSRNFLLGITDLDELLLRLG